MANSERAYYQLFEKEIMSHGTVLKKDYIDFYMASGLD